MSDLIFSYRRDNAWCAGISTLEVYDRLEDSVVAIKGHVNIPEGGNFNLGQEDLDKIKEIIANATRLFDKDYVVEDYPSLEGHINLFDFYKEGDHAEITVLNLGNLVGEEKTENSTYLMQVFDSIKEVLVKNGVDEKYFKL